MGPNMKHQQNHQRQRGRGRKPGGGGGGGGGGGHNSNRSFESTGPDIKVRGSASHVYEKYLQLARDANSSGDRVMAESYFQHAEHYFRILNAMSQAQQQQGGGQHPQQRRWQGGPDQQDQGQEGGDQPDLNGQSHGNGHGNGHGHGSEGEAETLPMPGQEPREQP
jgi:hypothetical protein